jgi:hypothetical protein
MTMTMTVSRVVTEEVAELPHDRLTDQEVEIIVKAMLDAPIPLAERMGWTEPFGKAGGKWTEAERIDGVKRVRSIMRSLAVIDDAEVIRVD